MRPATLALVGAGRAGASLARLWHNSEAFKIVALHTRRGKAKLAEEIGATNCQHLYELPTTDALLIATSDKAIAAVVQELLQHNSSWDNKLVFHLSGALSATELAPLAEKGARIASAHPVRAFGTEHSVFTGTWVGLEGDELATNQLRDAFEAIGGHCFEVDGSHKANYHAAAVIASNHLVALADAAQQLWHSAGVEPHISKRLFESLVPSVLNNLKEQAPVDALTGPIARGDSKAIRNHIHALDAENLDIAQLYRQNSRYLLHMLEHKLTAETRAEILSCLSENPGK